MACLRQAGEFRRTLGHISSALVGVMTKPWGSRHIDFNSQLDTLGSSDIHDVITWLAANFISQ